MLGSTLLPVPLHLPHTGRDKGAASSWHHENSPPPEHTAQMGFSPQPNLEFLVQPWLKARGQFKGSCKSPEIKPLSNSAAPSYTLLLFLSIALLIFQFYFSLILSIFLSLHLFLPSTNHSPRSGADLQNHRSHPARWVPVAGSSSLTSKSSAEAGSSPCSSPGDVLLPLSFTSHLVLRRAGELPQPRPLALHTRNRRFKTSKPHLQSLG